MKPLLVILLLIIFVLLGIGVTFFTPFSKSILSPPQPQELVTPNISTILRTTDVPTVSQTSELIDVIQRGFGAITTMLGIPLLVRQLKTEKKRRAAVRSTKPVSEPKKKRRTKKVPVVEK